MKEKPLTVWDLMAMLRELPPDMQLITTRYSDYRYQLASEWSVVKAVETQVGYREWLKRVHPSMSAEDLARAKRYFHMDGN